MADQRNIIKIILEAQDNTRAAFASVIANSALLEAAQKKFENQNISTAKSLDEVAKGIGQQDKALKDLSKTTTESNRDTRKSLLEIVNAQRDLTKARIAGGKTDREIVELQDRLLEKSAAARAVFKDAEIQGSNSAIAAAKREGHALEEAIAQRQKAFDQLESEIQKRQELSRAEQEAHKENLDRIREVSRAEEQAHE